MKLSTKVVLSYVWAIPIGAVGLLLTLSIVAAPVGLVLLSIAAYPLYRTIKNDPMPVEKPTEARKGQLPEPWGDGPAPWFVIYEKETVID